MPVRDRFPKEYFNTNPMEGESAEEAYKRLQWGNSPNNSFRIEAPEPLSALGRLAKVFFDPKGVNSFKDNRYYVAVGVETNYVYFVPMDKRHRPISFPEDFLEICQPVAKVRRTDYYSEKGGEAGYYYHDHEKPYPTLCQAEGHFVLAPSRHRGGRSYAVNDEGIIG